MVQYIHTSGIEKGNAMKKNTPEYWKAVREVTWGHLVTVGFFAIVFIQIALVVLYHIPDYSRTVSSITRAIAFIVLFDSFWAGASFVNAIKLINEEIENDKAKDKRQQNELEDIDQGDW